MNLAKFVLLNEDAKMPTIGTPDSAGYDVYSSVEVEIPAHGAAIINTGLGVDMDSYLYARVAGRSGLGFSQYDLVPFPGTIDADYREEDGTPSEVMIKLFNLSSHDYYVYKGEKIAQLIFGVRTMPVEVEIIKAKRVGGFGSTGK